MNIEWKKTGRKTGPGPEDLSLVYDDDGPVWASVDKIGPIYRWIVIRRGQSGRVAEGATRSQDASRLICEFAIRNCGDDPPTIHA